MWNNQDGGALVTEKGDETPKQVDTSVGNSTVVSTSIGSPLIKNGLYFHFLTASIAAGTKFSGPLIFFVSFLRQSIEGGRLGGGVEQPWQTEMKQLGVRAARIEVYLTWFFGPRNLTPVRVVYYDSYDGQQQVTDSATLARFKASGLEAKLRAEAIRRAPDAHWVDVPRFVFWPFKAATAVTVWDDPWLPNLPHMFTTFGPGRPPLVAAIGFGDLADTDRLLASGNVNKKSLNEALWYSCSDHNPQILQRLVKAGVDVNQIDSRKEFGTCLMIAVWANAPEVVRTLIASGAKVNGAQGKYNETPLAVALRLGSRETAVLKLLRDAGAK